MWEKVLDIANRFVARYARLEFNEQMADGLGDTKEIYFLDRYLS
jgi:hypothetical protein